MSLVSKLKPRLTQPGFLTALCLFSLFAINAYVCQTLFFTEYTRQTDSIESAFISFEHWLATHWEDRSWFPLWIHGLPTRQVYNPLLHHTVALLSRIVHWSAPLTYHFLTATTYSLGPVTLFWLAYRWSGRRGLAYGTALIYSLLAPSLVLLHEARADAGGLWAPRRLQTLVQYGEGPHVTALMLIPFVIWMLDEAAARRRWKFLLAAPVAVAIIPLTNWTGTTGLTMAITAYAIAKFGAKRTGDAPLHWPTFAGIGILAYGLACYWIPPSLIQTVQSSSVKLDRVSTSKEKLTVAAVIAVMLLLTHWISQRFRIHPMVRFCASLAILSGGVAIASGRYHVVLVPIATRFHLEMEMGIAGVAAFAVLAFAQRMPRRVQYAAIVLCVLGSAYQVRRYEHYARDISSPIDFTKTAEYDLAQWFAAHMQDHRVYAGGNTSYWMNLFSDVQQLRGCCDQSVREETFRAATYVIHNPSPHPDFNDAESGIFWLKVFGVSAVSVQALETSGDHPYGNPKKFDGVLPELWRSPSGVVYQVPRANDSLAHVLPQTAIPEREPVNGLDFAPLRPLVDALDHPRTKASLRWLNQHEFEVAAATAPGEVIYVQETCDPGWRAQAGGNDVALRCDPIGFMVAEPQASGAQTIHFTYGHPPEDRYTRMAQVIALLLIALWTWFARRKQLRTAAA